MCAARWLPMETMLAAVRAADQATLYSLYFPDHGHVKAAAVAGCVCLDDLTCTECERILGVSFLAIELAARKKQRRDPPVPVLRVDAGPRQGLRPGSHGVEASVAAISGKADRLGRASHQSSDGVEGSDAAISGTADRLVVGSHSPSDGIEGSDGAISSMADRLEPGSNGRVEGFEAAISGMAAPLVPGSYPPSEEVEGSDAAMSGTADRLVPGSQPPSDGIEGSDGAISIMADRPELGSNGVVDGFEAAISGTVDRLVPGSHPPSDGIDGCEAAISGTADPLVPGSNGVVEGFEAAISRLAARVGLAATIGERAKDVFRKMEEARAWPPGPSRAKYRSKCPLAYAACLSIACRNEGTARSLRELALATADGGGGVAAAASRWEIARLIAHIRRRLGEEEAGQAKGIGMVSVSSFTRRFGALVGLGEAECTVALEAARRLDEGVVDVRHNVDSVAAAVVCIALERGGAKRPSVKDVEAATGVSCVTIHTVCRKLRDHGDLLFH